MLLRLRSFFVNWATNNNNDNSTNYMLVLRLIVNTTTPTVKMYNIRRNSQFTFSRYSQQTNCERTHACAM